MNDKLDKLRARGAEAIEKYEEYRASIEASSKETTLGDLYVFPVPMDIALRMTPILTHPDDEDLYFCVPVDDFSWEGPTDIAVHGHPLGPMVVRCNHGLWLRDDDIEQGRLVGRLDAEVADDAAQIMSDMVTGELSPTSEQLETELLPEYDEWVARVEEGVQQLEVWKRRTAAVIDLGDFRSEKGNESQEGEECPRLAAAPSGLSGELQNLDGPSSSQTLEFEGWEGPGEVSLRLDEEQLSVVFEAQVEQPPRLEVTDNTGKIRGLEWSGFPGGGLWHSESVDVNEAVCVSVILDEDVWAELRLRD